MPYAFVRSFLSFVQWLFLGPIWLLPTALWSGLQRRFGRSAVTGALMLPGLYALGMLLAGAIEQWPLATVGPLARQGARAYSPIHRLLDELMQVALLMQDLPLIKVCAALAYAWLLVVVLTTVFLSPCYAPYAMRLRRP